MGFTALAANADLPLFELLGIVRRETGRFGTHDDGQDPARFDRGSGPR
jgi:hypothetical protein